MQSTGGAFIFSRPQKIGDQKGGKMSIKLIVLAITLFIYVLIIVAFNKARSKYQGGKVGDVINLILVTVVLLFIADYVGLLDQYLSENITFFLQTVFRTTALSFLALGGTRIASR
jgi:hypothetical protein